MDSPNDEQLSKRSLFIRVITYVGLTCFITYLVAPPLINHGLYLVLFVLPLISLPFTKRVPYFGWTITFQYVATVLFLILCCLRFSGFSHSSSLIPMLTVGVVMLAVGFCGLSIVGSYKFCTGGNDLGVFSAKAELVFLHLLIVCFVNGYFMVSEWCYYHENKSLQILGFVGILVLEVLSGSCLVLVVVEKCKELQKKRDVEAVNSINQDPELSQAVSNAINQNPGVKINVHF